jgi:hypothetical protein
MLRAALLLLLASSASLSADVVVCHSGGVNACGCHFNRKTGECHCHHETKCGCACQPPSCQ